MNYSGDLDIEAAWIALKSDRDAALVDVRTQAEWTFVGVPEIRSLGKSPILLEWQVYPSMAVNSEFVARLAAELMRRGATESTHLYFLCRSGGRSRAAAQAMTAAGYRRCYNILGGFEGDANEQQHRGQMNGWKAQGLPWIQS